MLILLSPRMDWQTGLAAHAPCLLSLTLEVVTKSAAAAVAAAPAPALAGVSQAGALKPQRPY